MDMENELLKCDPQDVSIKTFFLGPQAENQEWVRGAVNYLLTQWFQWRESCFPNDGEAIPISNRTQDEFLFKQKKFMNLLQELSHRFEGEVPKFTPRYVGHMLSELSLPALLGHILTLLHNPNNISGESSLVGIQIEKEAIEDLCKMVGWSEGQGLGHFTSGGTIANFESLLRAKYRLYQWLSLGTYLKEQKKTDRSLFYFAHMGWKEFDRHMTLVNQEEFSQWKQEWLSNPIRFAHHVSRLFHVNFEGPVLLVSQSKHYSWPKGVQLLGMGSDRLVPVELDKNGRMSVSHLRELINKFYVQNIPIAGIVSVAGTTELGTVDPLDEIHAELQSQLQNGYHFWHHIDAAYGGFLCSMIGMEEDQGSFSELITKLKAMRFANSITIDPHKLGYVPYSSGVILVKDRREYSYQEIQAPYIQFDSKNDVGLQTLEGSRSAAGAVATWLTERSIGLNPDGYGRILARTILVKDLIQAKLAAEGSLVGLFPGLDTNVLCFCIASSGNSLSQINNGVQTIYNQFAPTNSKSPFIFSKTQLKFKNYGPTLNEFIRNHEIRKDAEDLSLIRLCLMNPFILSKETKVKYTEELIASLKFAIKNHIMD